MANACICSVTLKGLKKFIGEMLKSNSELLKTITFSIQEYDVFYNADRRSTGEL
jgi:hypothetical protein